MNRVLWKITDIIKETNQTYTFLLKSEGDLPVNYEAGQFLTFIFQHADKEVRRSYSMSSAPGIDKQISITVKRVPNGEISRHLIDHIRVNDTLVSILPAGRFTVDTRPDQKRQFFFIAGGSGIVPVFSLIKKILKEEQQSCIMLIFQNHNEEEIIFKNHFSAMEEKYSSRFKWINLLSRPFSFQHHPEKLNNFLLERLVTENLLTNIPALFYICGPSSFMRMSQFTLKWMGFTDEQIRKENFAVDFIPPPPEFTDSSAKKIVIHFNEKIFRITASYPVNILQAALDKNIQLPYSCRSGRCSSCVARCISGKIKMSNNEVLTDKDLQSGLVLTCVGYAETDVELEW